MLRRRRQPVRQHQRQLPQVRSGAPGGGGGEEPRLAEQLDGAPHQQGGVGAVLCEGEAGEDAGGVGAGGGGERRPRRPGERVRDGHVGAEAQHADRARLGHGEGAADHDEGLEGQAAGAGLSHAARVIDAEQHAVLAAPGRVASHPDAVAPVARRHVGHDAPHVEPLARAVRARRPRRRPRRRQHQPQLRRQRHRQRVRSRLERRPQLQRRGKVRAVIVAGGPGQVRDARSRELRGGLVDCFRGGAGVCLLHVFGLDRRVPVVEGALMDRHPCAAVFGRIFVGLVWPGDVHLIDLRELDDFYHVVR